jgi:hypothetical protein
MDASPPDDSMATIAPARIKLNAARRSVIVKAPVGQVYEQWSRVEDLPKFITPLRNVQRMDDTRFSYTWSGSRQSDEHRGIFQILLRIPRRRIAWGYNVEWFNVRCRLLRAASASRNGNNAESTFDFRTLQSLAKSERVSRQFQTAG